MKSLTNKKLALVQILFVLLLTGSVKAEYEELTELKEYAKTQIKKYAQNFSQVNENFEGMRSYGNFLLGLDLDSIENIEEVTVKRKDYWRATLEMASTDPQIYFITGNFYLLTGNPSLAKPYFFIKNYAGDQYFDLNFKEDLVTVFDLYNKLIKKENEGIQKGIELNDEQKYSEAIIQYEEVIKGYPNSAWAYYEIALSYMWIPLSEDSTSNVKRTEALNKCRQLNPFYWLAYQGVDQEVIKLIQSVLKTQPYFDGEDFGKESLSNFAVGCNEINLFGLAALAEWDLALSDSKNQKLHLKKFLGNLKKVLLKEEDFKFIESQFNIEELYKE